MKFRATGPGDPGLSLGFLSWAELGLARCVSVAPTAVLHVRDGRKLTLGPLGSYPLLQQQLMVNDQFESFRLGKDRLGRPRLLMGESGYWAACCTRNYRQVLNQKKDGVRSETA